MRRPEILMPLERIYNANSLYNGFMKSKEGVQWKESVQKYETNLLLNIYTTQKELKNGTYKTKPMTEFLLCERGHTRHIKAQHIRDRVVQRSLNDNVLIPKVRPKLIHDNGASLKGKGLAFSRRRFETHLRKAYREYGGDAYILLMDFRKYYDNVQHEKAFELYAPILDEEEMNFLKFCFKDFEADVSYMTDEEYAASIGTVFDALKHAEIPQELKTGTKFLKKSLGIGNQSAQVTGIFYPNRIDQYCKTVKRIKYYGRYMDDTYIILPDKQELKKVYEEIKEICADMGIFISGEKSRIRKITGWLTWLKINYKLKPTGGLIRKVHSSTIRRERRRLKRFMKLYRDGRMTEEKIRECFNSWRGCYRKYDSTAKLNQLEKYLNYLLKEANNGRTDQTNDARTGNL